MVSAKDIFIAIGTGLYWILSSILLGVFVHPILIVPNFIAVVAFKINNKRKKRIAPFLKKDFAELGYKILKERPLRFREQKFEFSLLQPTVNEVPISRYGYVRRFARVFLAEKENGQRAILNCVVTRTWSGKNKIELISVRTTDYVWHRDS